MAPPFRSVYRHRKQAQQAAYQSLEQMHPRRGAPERLAAYQSLEAAVQRLLVDGLGPWPCHRWARGTVTLSQDPVDFGHDGAPRRANTAKVLLPDDTAAHQDPVVLVPTAVVHLSHQPLEDWAPWDGVGMLRYTAALRKEEEDEGQQEMQRPGGPAVDKFGVELVFAGAGDSSTWFPPASIDLPCNNGDVIEYCVGDKAALQRWRDSNAEAEAEAAGRWGKASSQSSRSTSDEGASAGDDDVRWMYWEDEILDEEAMASEWGLSDSD